MYIYLRYAQLYFNIDLKAHHSLGVFLIELLNNNPSEIFYPSNTKYL